MINYHYNFFGSFYCFKNTKPQTCMKNRDFSDFEGVYPLGIKSCQKNSADYKLELV